MSKKALCIRTIYYRTSFSISPRQKNVHTNLGVTLQIRMCVHPGMEGDGVKVSRNAQRSDLAFNEQYFAHYLQNLLVGYQITGGGGVPNHCDTGPDTAVHVAS